MADGDRVPQARAVGGVEQPRRRWLTRTAVVVRSAGSSALTECSCCRRVMSRESRAMYCARCHRHQRLYKLAMIVGFAGCLWIGRLAGDVAFGIAPFASLPVHLALVFGVAAVCPLVFLLAANAFRSDPAHGHWGPSVVHGAGRCVTFRSADYGRALAAQIGAGAEEATEPRTGWVAIGVFLLVPALCAALAYWRFDDRRFVVYVDNGTAHDLRISVAGHGEVGSVAAGGTMAISLPRAAMTVSATSGGAPIEDLSVGGIDEILANQYPDLFPDIEYDVGDVFIWNVNRARCYESDTKMYGSIGGFGTGPKALRDKAFVSNTDEPFERAPSSVTSTLPFDVRSELVRVPCD